MFQRKKAKRKKGPPEHHWTKCISYDQTADLKGKGEQMEKEKEREKKNGSIFLSGWITVSL